MNDLTLKREAPSGGRCERCGVAGHGGTDAVRCDCGSMLARHVAGGIELKCRRCKRVVVIPIAPAGDDATVETEVEL
ncbi:hypothetical protein BE04_26950 [Sorangium cellulosum]|uniref:Uncharacterized protein n=1 Tax=Sorangium cellulosum TaxID=56 RepID=A0A150THG8_SORCE|nr:hypothetical protein [Sorangium cellulosum]KYF53069.1 hypothetical protein BE04_26950 [Sorangium cellulosum]KYG04121.1 hypothetical protein BE21_48325 [Sorangium cellulosum]